MKTPLEKRKESVYAFIAFTTIIVIGFGSCKKPTYDYIDPEFKQAFTTFKLGSYWIYQDSVTLELDSFFMYGNGAGTIIDGDGKGYNE